MKNLYTLIVFVYSFCTYAQDFAFELKNRTYVNLTGSISITNGDVWDDPQYAVPLGFTISVYDTTLSTLYFSGIGSGGELSTYLAPQDIKSPLLSFVGTDVVDRGYGTATSLSDISYKVTGVVGSRIGVIEFKNVGFYYETDPDGISTDYANFQIWIYEENSAFEVHFGESSITQPALCYNGADGLYTGLCKKWDYMTYNSVSANQVLVGTASSPVLQTKPNHFANFMIGWPSSGTVYRFTQTTASLLKDKMETFTLYPNPSNGVLRLKSNEYSDIKQVSIYGINGIKLVDLQIEGLNHSTNLLENINLTRGTYILIIKNSQSTQALRFNIE